jgi:hypothetical protein
MLSPLLMSAAELTVDHVTAAGQDLRTMQANLAAVGIACEYGGPHKDGVTEMALTSFADGSYLELIAPQAKVDSKALAANAWGKQMEGNAGPCAWAVRAKDLAAEVKRLQEAGVAVGDPVRSGRAKPGGTHVEWEMAQVGKEPRGTFFPFLIHDFTPRPDRAFLNGKPTTRDFTGVNTVVIAVRDLKEAVKRYREAYGLPDPIKQVDKGFGAHMALMAGTTVVLAAPLSADSWLNDRLDRFGEGPCAFILGARSVRKYKPASQSRWFGNDISWFDPEKLGWYLGFER